MAGGKRAIMTRRAITPTPTGSAEARLRRELWPHPASKDDSHLIESHTVRLPSLRPICFHFFFPRYTVQFYTASNSRVSVCMVIIVHTIDFTTCITFRQQGWLE